MPIKGFRESTVRISDCRASSILKTVPVSQDSKEFICIYKLGEFVHNNTSLYLELLGISKQSLNTLLRIPGFLWIFIGSSLSVWELECFLSVENIEISPYAQAQQSLLLLTQGNIYNRLRFLNKYLMFLEELNELFRENWSKFLTSGYLVFLKQFPAAGYLDTSKHQRYAYSSAGSQSLSFDFCNWTYF